MLRSFLPLLFSVLVIGCTKNDSDPPDTSPIEKYLQINVGPNPHFNGPQGDYWVIVHNEKGEMLDYRLLEIGKTLIFEAHASKITDKLTVTDFYYNPSTESANLYSEAGVKKGSTRNFGQAYLSNPETPIKEGEFEFTIFNAPSATNISLAISTRYSVSGGLNNRVGDVMRGTGVKYQDANEFLINITNGLNELKYLFFLNPDGAALTIDYDDLLAYDEYVYIDSPPVLQSILWVEGYEENEYFNGVFSGFRLDSDSFEEKFPAPIGYLNRFQKFYTFFEADFEDYSYSYRKYGGKSEGIQVPSKLQFSVLDSSVFNYDFTSEYKGKRIISNWNYYINDDNEFFKSASWSVQHNSDYHPKIGLFPSELLKIYPKFELDKFEYKNSDIFINYEPSNGQRDSSTDVNVPIEIGPFFYEKITIPSSVE